MAASKIRKYFRSVLQRITQRILMGTFLVFPFTATVIVLYWIVNGSDKLLSLIFVDLLKLLPEITWHPLISVILAVSFLYLIGMVSTLLIVRKALTLGERLVQRIPIINFVYNTTKQIADAISIQSQQTFKKVVMIEYPRKGIYALAFMTGQTEQADKTNGNYVNVFLPTTPNPTSGFFLLLPRSEVMSTNLSVEEGVKMIISGGILTPRPLTSAVISEDELRRLRLSGLAGKFHADDDEEDITRPSGIKIKKNSKEVN
jgi:uncharacterized membrane protein